MRNNDDGGPGAAAGGPELILVTKTDCHLCAAAHAVVALAAEELGTCLGGEVDRRRSALAERFAEEVPVVLVDGVQRDFWNIDPVRLRRVLREAMTARR